MRLTHQNRPFASTNKKKSSTSRKKPTPKHSSEAATADIIPSAITPIINESAAVHLQNAEYVNINVQKSTPNIPETNL